MAKGLHLGPVGGRIVAWVIIGLLQSDRASFFAGRWVPDADVPHCDRQRSGLPHDRLPDLRRG